MSQRSSIRATTLILLLGLAIGACQPGGASQDDQTMPQQEAEPAQSLGYADALSLYASDSPRLSDTGFQRITDFYGVKRVNLDVKTTRLTDTLLRDQSGTYFPMIHVDAQTLARRMDRTAWKLLEDAVTKGGVDLLVSALQTDTNPAVRELTNDEILGSSKPQDHDQDYLISK